jgi:hypothetical protein
MSPLSELRSRFLGPPTRPGEVDTATSPLRRSETLFEGLSPRADFPDAPFAFQSRLTHHPLFTDERIERLLARARRLAPELLEIREAQADALPGYGRARRVGDEPVSVFRALASCPRWINVQHVERIDPDFAELHREIVRELARSIAPMRPHVLDSGAFLILSSPRVQVHFHADPDQSVLSQIRGQKRLHMYTASAVSEVELEALVRTEDHGVIPWSSRIEGAAFPPIDLHAGESAFLPIYAPHRVENGPDVSVSLSVGFHTEASRRRKLALLLDDRLRGRGLLPLNLGHGALEDRAKATLFRAWNLSRRLRGRPS